MENLETETLTFSLSIADNSRIFQVLPVVAQISNSDSI